MNIIADGGIILIPLIACSILSLAITIERGFALQLKKIAPLDTLNKTWNAVQNGKADDLFLSKLSKESPLGEVLVEGLNNSRDGRELMSEHMAAAGARVAHSMERYLNTLGTIATVTPLLGLLGTVMGMITVFSEIVVHGTGNANLLAGGISQALSTTAVGLAVAIPSVAVHRFYLRRVSKMLLAIEHESTRLLDAFFGSRGVIESQTVKR